MLFVFILLNGCTIEKTEVKSLSEVTPTPALSPEIKSNVFDQYLKSDFAPADGFDFPVGNSSTFSVFKRGGNWNVHGQI